MIRLSGRDTLPPSDDGHTRVVLVTASPVPDGDASAHRQWHLVRAATAAGTPPLVVHDRPDAGSPSASRIVDGTELITMGAGGGGRLRRLLARQTRSFRVIRVLADHGLVRGRVSAVILPMNVMTLVGWAVYRATLGCPVIVDVTERHDRQQFRHGWLAPYFVRHRWSSLLTTRLVHRATTASSSLAHTMKRSGLDVLTVPAPLDCAEFVDHRRPRLDAGLRLIYAGTPGRKDLLDVILQGIALLGADDQRRVHLTIAGISGADARQSDLSPATLDAASADIRFVGRVPRATVLDLLSESHFSVLVRPDRGYATHGFPSKVPESLAAGCPVLLNHTSDLPLYVRDGIEGLVLKGPQASAVAAGLARALRLSDEEWAGMSRAARARAWQSFDYRGWRPPVLALIEGRRPPTVPENGTTHSDLASHTVAEGLPR